MCFFAMYKLHYGDNTMMQALFNDICKTGNVIQKMLIGQENFRLQMSSKYLKYTFWMVKTPASLRISNDTKIQHHTQYSCEIFMFMR